MVRKLVAIGALAGVVLCGGTWLAAAGATIGHTTRPDGVSIGYGHGQQWLVNAMIYSDGQLFCRWFRPNLTHHNGVYGVRISGLRPWHVSQSGLTSSNQFSRSIRLHVSIPLGLCAALSLLVVGLPAFRRLRRQRRGLCPNCGYDLRNTASTLCPECGQQSRQ